MVLQNPPKKAICRIDPKICLEQGRKRPLDTPKRMIEREREKERERKKGRRRDTEWEGEIRERERERGKRDREVKGVERLKG